MYNMGNTEKKIFSLSKTNAPVYTADLQQTDDIG